MPDLAPVNIVFRILQKKRDTLRTFTGIWNQIAARTSRNDNRKGARDEGSKYAFDQACRRYSIGRPPGDLQYKWTDPSWLPLGGPENVNVFLHHDLNVLRLFNSDYGPVSINAIGGRFDLFYTYIAGPGLPKNLFMQFGCWDLRR
ncbi:MAG TPA: hypothetical protein VLA93_10710 [Pyrinomonadaceae bacterium]|nr:hypothetical protein [Pyrinomonadaceae bacterium]